MKANIKPELKQQSSGKLSRSEMKKWGPLTPGEWVVVAFIGFSAAMFYGDKTADSQQGNEVMPSPIELAGDLVGKLDSGAGEPSEIEVVAGQR